MINGQTNGPCPEYSFNSANNQVTNTGYTYDAAGNLTSDGTNTYQYDAEGREISVNGSSNWAAAYNVLGQVVQRYYAAQGETDSFIWDPSSHFLANWSENRGFWWDSFVRHDGSIVADNRQAENTAWFLHSDMLGSTKGVTTSMGQMMWDNVDYPWGQDWTYAGSNWGFFASLPLPLSEIGQMGALHRSYSTGLGRWLSPDPARLSAVDPSNPQTWNAYTYAENNPTTLTDPSGLGPSGLGGGIGECPFIWCQPTCSDFFSSGTCEPPFPPIGPISPPVGFPIGGGGGGTDGGSAPTVAANPPAASPLGPFSGSVGGPPGFVSNAQVIEQIGVYASPWEIDVVSICAADPACLAVLLGTGGVAIAAHEGVLGQTLQTLLPLPVQAGIQIHQAKGGKQNIVPSWAEGARPFPGESASKFADRLCKQQYPPDGAGCGFGPGSERNKIRKWAHDKFGI